MKPYFETEKGRLYHGDYRDLAPTLKEKAALICIDPPYNIGKDDWDKIPDYETWMGEVFKACESALADNGSFYWFHNKMPVIARLMGWIEGNTSFVYKSFIVWDKGDFRALNWKNPSKDSDLRSWFPTCEYCLFYTFQDETGLNKIMGSCVDPISEYLRKEILRAKERIVFKEINQMLGTADNGGGVASACLSEKKTVPAMITEEHYLKLRAWLNQEKDDYLRREYEDLRKEYEDLRYTHNTFPDHKNIWKFKERNSGEFHVTQKPLAMISNIIKTSSNPGDLCVDFFGGSGTLGEACENLKRRWIMCEKEESYCEIAARRIESAASQTSFEDFI